MKMVTIILAALSNGLGNALKTSPPVSLQVNLVSDPWDFKDGDYQYAGFKSQNEKDDNNTYTLELWTLPDCSPLISSRYFVSGQEAFNNFTNLTLQIRNGEFDGTNVSSVKPFDNTVWEEISTKEYDGGSDGSPYRIYYLIRLSAKYPASNTNFLQLVSSAYYLFINYFKNATKTCNGFVAGNFMIGGSILIVLTGFGYAGYKKCQNTIQNRNRPETPRGSSPGPLSITASRRQNHPSDSTRERLISPKTPSSPTSPTPRLLTINQ